MLDIDKLYHIMDYSGNYYRINDKNDLVVVKNVNEASVFSFIEANKRINIGHKDKFYLMTPVEDIQEEGQSDEEEMKSVSGNLANVIISVANEVKSTVESVKTVEPVLEYDISRIDWKEYLTHFTYVQLQEAGWSIGTNCTIEEPVTGMPNSTGVGYVDYVLWGKDNLPLAVVEAKKASVDTMVGSQQAKLYADCLQNKYNQRPLIFTTNGFEFYYTNDACGYPRREVSGFFTQEELQLEVDRRKQRILLDKIEIRDRITNRPYQKEAVTAVCDAISKKHRKMLIVQATGSGKTRVSISIVDVLRRHNYVKNILFLADRTALVKQAKNNYTSMLEDLACCNLCDNKDDPENARMIFSTYPTMMNAIDEKKNKFTKLPIGVSPYSFS